jgi:hypothetical protein
MHASNLDEKIGKEHKSTWKEAVEEPMGKES